MIFKLRKHQQKVFELLLQGLSCKEMAQRLNVAEKTVQFHSHHIYRKFGVHSKEQLILKVFHLNHKQPEIEIKEPKTLIEHLECVQAPNEPLPRGIA